MVESFDYMLKPFVDLGGIGIENQPLMCSISDFFRLICNPMKLPLDVEFSKSDLIVQVLSTILKQSYKTQSISNESGDNLALFYGMQLGAASALGNLCRYDDISNKSHKLCPRTKATLRKLLKRFGTNALSNDTISRSTNTKSTFGVLEYAINQTYSRDLTRRALIFQAILDSFGNDDDCITGIMFAISKKKKSLMSLLSDNFVRYQEQLEKLTEQYETMTREREGLEQDLADKDAFFAQEMLHLKRRSRADAVEHAETLMEEKRILDETLRNVNNDVKRLRDETIQQEKTFNSKLGEYQDKINHLEDQLKKIKQKNIEKDEEIIKKNEKITVTETKLQGLQEKFDEERKDKLILNQKHIELKDKNVNVKERLEDSLSKLILVAQNYVRLEKDSDRGQKELKERVNKSERKEQEIGAKYQRLKEIYRDAEDKIKNLSLDIKKLKQQASRRESERNASSNRNSERGNSSKRDFDKSHSQRRQPMGTLAFMNSIHDESMRVDRRGGKTKDSSSSRNYDSTKRSRSKSKSSSSYRIVR